MKYKAAKLQSGKWAVRAKGNKVYTNTIGTKEYATEQALVMSIQWYHEQSEKAWRMVEATAEKTNRGEAYGRGINLLDEDGTANDRTTEKGDLLC